MLQHTDFTPPSWLKNPHLQTLGSVFVSRSVHLFPSKDRYFNLPDGSRLVGECSWQKHRHDVATLLIIHGLNGSTISSYVRGTASKAYDAGFNVIRLNLRNGGGREELSKTLRHAGQSHDLQIVIEELLNHDQLKRLGIISFSYGANPTLKALAEWGNTVPKQIVGAVMISPLVDLTASADALDHHAPPIYRWQLLKGLRAKMYERNKLFPGKYNVEGLNSITTLRGFDDRFAPYNGFQDASDYYKQASALPLLHKITVPTLIISAKDDPVIPPQSFQRITNPHIQLLLTEYGGHGGFISAKKNGDADRHWAENRAIDFFDTSKTGSDR